MFKHDEGSSGEWCDGQTLILLSNQGITEDPLLRFEVRRESDNRVKKNSKQEITSIGKKSRSTWEMLPTRNPRVMHQGKTHQHPKHDFTNTPYRMFFIPLISLCWIICIALWELRIITSDLWKWQCLLNLQTTQKTKQLFSANKHKVVHNSCATEKQVMGSPPLYQFHTGV